MIGGIFVFLAALVPAGVSMWLDRAPSAAPSLISFTLNETESYFEPAGYVNSIGLSIPAWESTVEAQAVRLALEVVDEVADGAPPAEAESWYFSSLPDEIRLPRARQILQTVRAGGEQYRELIEKLSPVFDVTMLNKGEGTAVLTHLQVEIMDARTEFEGEGGGRDPRSLIPTPIESVHRYVLPLRKLYAQQYGGPEWPRVPLLPPIEVPAQTPARFQVQLYSDFHEYAYRLRLRFIYNGEIEVASPIFGVEFF